MVKISLRKMIKIINKKTAIIINLSRKMKTPVSVFSDLKELKSL